MKVDYSKNKSLKDIIYFDADNIQRTEVWLGVVGHEKLYKISNLGRVKRIPSDDKLVYFRTIRGNTLAHINPNNSLKILNLCKRNRYYAVRISNKLEYVHRLVAIAFLQNSDKKSQVNHKNLNRKDNKLSNLEWVSAQENVSHCVNLGASPKGSRCGNSKLNEKKVLLMRKLKSENSNLTNIELAKKFKVSRSLVALILHRKIWRHI